MTETALPWLLVLVLIPALGAVWVRRLVDRERARLAALTALTATAALAAWVAQATYQAGPGALLVDPLQAALVGEARPLLGVDALSAAPMLLFTLLALGAAAALPAAAADPPALGRLLWLTALTLGLYAALDLALVAALWGAALLPAARALARPDARRVLLVYQGAGWLCLVAAVALLARGAPAPLFIPDLDASRAGGAVVPLLVLAVLLRKGVFPFHSWVPALFEGAPAGVAGLFVAAHAGVYLFVRVVVLRLDGALDLALPVVAGLAIVTSLYAAVLALAQRELSRVVALLATSQSSFVLVGFAASDALGAVGSLMVWLSVAVALTGLALAAGCLEARFGPVDLGQPRGYAARAPRLGLLFLVLGLGCCGLPGLLGFVSEDLLFHGLLETYPLAGVAMVVAGGLNGFTVLRAYFHAFQGPAGDLPPVGDLLPRERLALTAMLVALLLAGAFPAPAIATRAGPARAVARTVARTVDGQ
ncbi:MAG: hypothetical protein M9894_16980 [Planctomycetes bacterium]|nr:hypothetical protein [Planctomycetota bacterium]